MALGTDIARADDDMPPTLEATLQLKVQSYDHKLAARVKNGYVVVVLYKADSKPSVDAAIAMSDAFTRVAERYRIKQLKPTIVTLAVDSKLLDTLRSSQANLIYVTPGLDASLETIIAAGNQLGAPTVTHVRGFVTAGLGIGVIVHDHKPKILVNLKAVVAAGMELDAEMLDLAEVLR